MLQVCSNYVPLPHIAVCIPHIILSNFTLTDWPEISCCFLRNLISIKVNGLRASKENNLKHTIKDKTFHDPGGNRVCGMDEFSIAVSVLQKDSKGKEVLEFLDQLLVTIEDHQVIHCVCCTISDSILLFSTVLLNLSRSISRRSMCTHSSVPRHSRTKINVCSTLLCSSLLRLSGWYVCCDVRVSTWRNIRSGHQVPRDLQRECRKGARKPLQSDCSRRRGRRAFHK